MITHEIRLTAPSEGLRFVETAGRLAGDMAVRSIAR